MKQENPPGYAQNSMFSLTLRTPGLLRRLTLHLAFYFIGNGKKLGLTRLGFLSDIGTIHSARWFVLPGTRRLAFISNFGGSWESYLEDFITKATQGTTSIWSNTIGFPKTEFLIFKGVKNGDAFKRFARRSMPPISFWYSAYPLLTCEQIRKHALIANGLALSAKNPNALSAADSEAWLELFGSIPRPAYGLEYEEIQTLILGGLKHHKFGRCIAINFSDAKAQPQKHPFEKVQDWLSGEIIPRVNFGDKLPPKEVCNIAFSASGLRKLGLEQELGIVAPNPLYQSPEDDAYRFPAPFALGMNHESRKRLLCDQTDLEWDDDSVDAVILIYTQEQNSNFIKDVLASIGQADLLIKANVTTELTTFDQNSFAKIWEKDNDEGSTQDEVELMTEPFGFVDGISQPKVRGFLASRSDDSVVHSLEPGEFILGYKDNRGFFPHSPKIGRGMTEIGMNPILVLGVTPEDAPQRYTKYGNATPNVRDFGRNGSYLVIR